MIAHHREGAGAPLVLIHGIGLRWQIWRPVIGALAEDFDVIACDSPGFGQSPPVADGVSPTIGAYADAFERFFAAEDLARPHVAGNSMGGAIALELARRGAVATATAISPAGFWTAAERRFCQASLVSLAQTPRAARPALEALIRTRAGRTALLWQTFAQPTRLPAQEAVATLRDAARRVGRPGVRRCAGGVRRLHVRRARAAHGNAADNRLGRAGPTASLPPAGAAGTRAAATRQARDTRGRPRALLRRPACGRRGDPHGRRLAAPRAQSA